MPKKRTISETAAEAARLESAAHELHDMVEATHKAAHDMRLRATAARKRAQQTTKNAKAQAAKAKDQTGKMHKTEKTGDAAHKQIRELSG
jgi:hypothetical protein